MEPPSRTRAWVTVCGVTVASAIFWTWCFWCIGHYFSDSGLQYTAKVFYLLRPSFSLAYFGLGLAAKCVAIARGRTNYWPWLMIHNWLYPCVVIGMMCRQMGRIDLSM